MKIQYLTIPAVLLSVLSLSAQKNMTPFGSNAVTLSRPVAGNSNSRRNIPENNTNPNEIIPHGVATVNCWIHPMDKNINTDYPEYTPVLTGNDQVMFFTSRRPENTGNSKTIDSTFKAEDIYISTLGADGAWEQATKLDSKINTAKNEAITWVSPEGNKMILCRNEDLFESSFVEGAWTKPEPMKNINTPYRETHASYSPDGNTIYFTTDDPAIATAGGLDICMTRKNGSGQWTVPVMVENINSPLNEEDPSLMPDGKTLYFSSQGFSAIGGYDIFTSVKQQDGAFSAPRGIGYPVNTVANEPFISFIDGGKKAFLSSDREAPGKQDIYEVTFTDFIKIPLLVEVYDAGTKQLINSQLTLTGQKNTGGIYLNNMSRGVFHADTLSLGTSYTLHAEASNYSSADLVISTENLPEFDPSTFKLVQKVYLDPAPVAVTDHKVHNLPLLNTVHFEYGKSTIESSDMEVVHKLKEMLLNNPDEKIVINAHTDNRGSAESNYKLSASRANAIAAWFVQNGIDIHRIQIKSYGEDEPVGDNATETGRASNRRAVIEIVNNK